MTNSLQEHEKQQPQRNRDHLIPQSVLDIAAKAFVVGDSQHIRERYLDQLAAIKEFCIQAENKYSMERFSGKKKTK